MREIGQGVTAAREKVAKLQGIPLLLKIDEGRGRSTLLHGEVVSVFPAIFTVKLSDGILRTFSYNDVLSNGVLFLKE